MTKETEARQKYASRRLGSLRDELGSAEEIASGTACVYATGSYGRIEANKNSDLDLFIVGLSKLNR